MPVLPLAGRPGKRRKDSFRSAEGPRAAQRSALRALAPGCSSAQHNRHRMISCLVPLRRIGCISFFKRENLDLLSVGLMRGQRKSSASLCDRCFGIVADDSYTRAFKWLIVFI